MKKLLVITLTALTLFTVVGCSSKNDTTGKNSEVSTNEQGKDTQIETTSYFGKVENVVGNEVSIKLADNEFGIGVEGDGDGSGLESFNLDAGQIAQLENGETVVFGDGSVVGSVAIAASGEAVLDESGSLGDGNGTQGDPNFSGEISIFGGDGSEASSLGELEFNGESKDVIIPAGVEIFNATNGKSGKISDIKQGSILTIIMDSKTNTVTRVDIVG